MASGAYRPQERAHEDTVLPFHAALRELPGARRGRDAQSGGRRRARGTGLADPRCSPGARASAERGERASAARARQDTVSSHALELPPALVAPRHEPLDSALADGQEAAVPVPPRRAARDVPLDLLRGLAMVMLVVNHLRLESALGHVTSAVLSAAEVLVAVSGVVVGMVFGRRWLDQGARATTAMLLRRSRKLYAASVVVVALVGVLTLVPGLATEALTVSPNVQPSRDAYAFNGALRTLLAIVTLEAGPWQFNILGFFIAALAVAPAVLWALGRGWWPAVVAGSWLLFWLGRHFDVDILPSQSERPFPVLVWQVLFINGIVLGWHRERISRWLRRYRNPICAAILVVAAAFAAVQLAGPALVDAATWARWEAEHFHKGSLDLARLLAMISIAAAVYMGFRRVGTTAERLLGPLLLPLGRNSFYVFIMHVFLCLAVASVPALGGQGLGLLGNTLVQLGCLAILSTMVRRRFLFRIVPR
jgi:hypothetical protein